MEIKKSAKASLENKKLLFTEIGLVIALGIVWAAFEHSSKEKQVAKPLRRRPRPRTSPSFPTRSTSWTMTSSSTTTCS